MLKHRLIFGPIMIAGLLALLYADERMDMIDLSGTFLGNLFDRATLPRGLPMLAFIWALIWLGSIEISRIFNAKRVPTKPWIVGLAGTVGSTLIYAMPNRLDSQMTMAIFTTLIIVM